MSNSRYTMPVNKYGYVQDGLELLLDGKDNDGTGVHNSSATVWKDLSGNNRDGTLTNMDIQNCWSENGLKFDGIDDYVPIAEMNYENVTLETVAVPNQIEGATILGNIESGGYQVYISSILKLGFNLYINELGEYATAPINNQQVINSNSAYYISGSYDNKKIKLLAMNYCTYYQEVAEIGSIGNPKNNTVMMLGSNPSGNLATGPYFNGAIYSARIYSKALSDEERAVNYATDKERYNL